MAYNYQAYGLRFRSDMWLPELPEVESASEEPVDVFLRLGRLSSDLKLARGYGYQANPDEFLLNCPDIARYLVSNGNEIVIEPLHGSIDSDVRVFLLGSAFGALLHQRQLLVMHASVINTPRGAVLFSGPSGAGKSTLLGEMMRRGYRMMVDDVCGVVLDSHNLPMVVPGYPRTRLWADSAAKLDVSTVGLPRTRQMLDKYECQLPDQFHDSTVPMHQIYLLANSTNTELKIEGLPAIHKFEAVLQNTYRNSFLDGLELRQPHFSMASHVARQVPVNRAIRPSAGFRLTEFADMIENHFSCNSGDLDSNASFRSGTNG